MSIKLITLDEFKAYKNMSTDTQYDSQLSVMITGASEMCKTYCRRSFIDYWDTDKTEYHDGTKSNELFLREFPIRTITSVEFSEDAATYTALVENTDFYVDPQLDTIKTVDTYTFAYGASVTIPPKSIRVVYKAGYGRVPEDLKLAIMDLVEHYRKGKSTPRKVMGEATIENSGFRAGANSKLPPNIARIFEMYKADQ